jgi:hypothetical protein
MVVPLCQAGTIARMDGFRVRQVSATPTAIRLKIQPFSKTFCRKGETGFPHGLTSFQPSANTG